MAYPGEYYEPPSPPKRSLGPIIGAIAAVVVLIICASLVLAAIWTSNHPKKSSASASGSPSASVDATPSIESTGPTSGRSVVGQPVRQKGLEITVLRAPDCGAKALGSGTLASKTQKGQYCLIDVRFRNVGSEAVKPDQYNTSLIDAQGGSTPIDFNSDQANPGGKNALFDNIYPGKTATGIVAFDIPLDQKPKTLKLNPVGEFTDEIDIDLA
jgi:hypothetical protein